MDVQFIASVAVITADPVQSRRLYMDALGLPLQAAEGDDYFHSESIGGSKHFGVWPLIQAAQACFGTDTWPADRSIPQASVKFEVDDARAVQAAAEELRDGRLHAAARCPHGAVGPNGRASSDDRRPDRRHLLRTIASPMTNATGAPAKPL